MKYQEYLTKLNELFSLEHKLILIYNKELALLAFDFYTKSKNSISDIFEWMNYRGIENIYAHEREEVKTNNLNQLSIMQALLIAQKLVSLNAAKVYHLQKIKEQVPKKLAESALVKKLSTVMNNFNNVYAQQKALTNQLNLTFTNNETNLTFDLNLIDDQPIDSVDFNKVLINPEWVKMLKDY